MKRVLGNTLRDLDSRSVNVKGKKGICDGVPSTETVWSYLFYFVCIYR